MRDPEVIGRYLCMSADMAAAKTSARQVCRIELIRLISMPPTRPTSTALAGCARPRAITPATCRLIPTSLTTMGCEPGQRAG